MPRLAVARVIDSAHDHVASPATIVKLVVFHLEELPPVDCAQGVTLQRYRDGGLSDAITFTLDEGTVPDDGRQGGRRPPGTEGEMVAVEGRARRGGADGGGQAPRDNTFD